MIIIDIKTPILDLSTFIDLAIWRSCLVSTMLTSVTGQDSSISQHLRATKRVLQDMILNAEYVFNDKVHYARSLKSAFSVS